MVDPKKLPLSELRYSALLSDLVVTDMLTLRTAYLENSVDKNSIRSLVQRRREIIDDLVSRGELSEETATEYRNDYNSYLDIAEKMAADCE